MTNRKTCPACGGEMTYETRPDTIPAKGQTRSVESTGWWCNTCDEAIFDGAELERADREFQRTRARQ